LYKVYWFKSIVKDIGFEREPQKILIELFAEEEKSSIKQGADYKQLKYNQLY